MLRRRPPLQPRPLPRPRLVKPPLFVQSIFGILGGIGAGAENLMHMKTTADRLFGDDYYWSVLGAGRHQTSLVTMAAILGGNVRVGLEDSIYLGRGRAGEVERRAGREDPPHPGGALARDRHARRGARHPGAEGRRPRRVLKASSITPPFAQKAGKRSAQRPPPERFRQCEGAVRRIAAWHGACKPVALPFRLSARRAARQWEARSRRALDAHEEDRGRHQAVQTG